MTNDTYRDYRETVNDFAEWAVDPTEHDLEVDEVVSDNAVLERVDELVVTSSWTESRALKVLEYTRHFDAYEEAEFPTGISHAPTFRNILTRGAFFAMVADVREEITKPNPHTDC